MPGTSRHHWGTDIDFNSVDPAYFKTATGIKVLSGSKPTLLILDFANHIHSLAKPARRDFSLKNGIGAIFPLHINFSRLMSGR